MSTVPDLRKASFRYGYREVRKTLPNGRSRWVRVPLALEDVLHPQEGDVHLPTDPHTDDCTYLRDVLKDRYAGDYSVVVFSDCFIYWDVPRLKHHAPDLAVIFGVNRQEDWKPFHVKTEKVRPALIIEVTLPKTRILDLKPKVQQYARARVPYYVIADAEERGGKRRLTFIAYRLEGSGYQPVDLDQQGRARLEPVGLWLGVRVNPKTGGDRVALIDPATGEETGDDTTVNRARVAAEARAQVEAEARAVAEAEVRAQAEARAVAEARVQELEARLRRPRGRKTR